MPVEPAELVERVRAHYDHGCFACGLANPIGLHLDGFAQEDGQVTARFVPRSDFRGLAGILHGGIAATAIDEILVWAGILSQQVMSVTGTLDLRFRRTVRLDDRITVAGRVTERRGRRLRVEGELMADRQVAVEGRGLYVVTHRLADLLA